MAHGEAVEAVSMAQYQGPLPPELWTAVLAKADHRSLKNARRVNTTFRDLATPFLFDHIVYSVDEKNIRNLRLLSRSNLSKHVQFMYLDTTSYRQAIDTRRYAQLTSGYFGAAFNLGLQKSGPLSESALLKILARSSCPVRFTLGSIQP
jgi:F-box domain